MVVYANLTQNTCGDRFVYLRSTDVEQMNWERLLWSVPDEMLYFLSLGHEIVIEDVTTDPKGGKIKNIFCPIFEAILGRLYFSNNVIKCPHLKEHFTKAWDTLMTSKLLLTKYRFWKDKIPTTFVVRGEGVYVKTEPNPIGGSMPKDWLGNKKYNFKED